MEFIEQVKDLKIKFFIKEKKLMLEKQHFIN